MSTTIHVRFKQEYLERFENAVDRGGGLIAKSKPLSGLDGTTFIFCEVVCPMYPPALFNELSIEGAFYRLNPYGDKKPSPMAWGDWVWGFHAMDPDPAFDRKAYLETHPERRPRIPVHVNPKEADMFSDILSELLPKREIENAEGGKISIVGDDLEPNDVKYLRKTFSDLGYRFRKAYGKPGYSLAEVSK